MEGWAPAIDGTETDQEVVVKADVPGIDQKDLEMHLPKTEDARRRKIRINVK